MWGPAYVESNEAIVLYVCCVMHHVDVIHVIVSCMIPLINIIFPNVLYGSCVRIVSNVPNERIDRICIIYQINAWSRDATSSSIMAYLIPGLHLYFCFLLSFCPTLSSLFPPP